MTPAPLAQASEAALSTRGRRSGACREHAPANLEGHRAAPTVTRKILGTLPAITRAQGRPPTVAPEAGEPFLDKRFVDPPWIGRGHGTALMTWAPEVARGPRARHLVMDSDPQARGFHDRAGAVHGCAIAFAPPQGCPLPRLPLAL
jgi:GNAT superfamily N-acetyltransferase